VSAASEKRPSTPSSKRVRYSFIGEALFAAEGTTHVFTRSFSVVKRAWISTARLWNACVRLNEQLRARGVRLIPARVKEAVRSLLEQSDPAGLGDAARMFWSVDAAVQAAAIAAPGSLGEPADPEQPLPR